MLRDDRRRPAWALGALVIAAAAPVVVLQALGMLESADDKRTAALPALVGVTVTACGSVIGTLVSRQSERRLAHEHEDEQSRLRLDAAMKAGALFNANGDASPDPAAVAVAAELLCRNADRLDIGQSLHSPASIDGRWNARFGVKTKVLIVDALVHMAVKGEASLNALQSLRFACTPSRRWIPACT
jgi:hypothetical protein